MGECIEDAAEALKDIDIVGTDNVVGIIKIHGENDFPGHRYAEVRLTLNTFERYWSQDTKEEVAILKKA